MSQSTKILRDASYPRLVVFAWFNNGECNQVILTGQQRLALYDTMVRMHDFNLRVGTVNLPLKWPDEETRISTQAADPGCGQPDLSEGGGSKQEQQGS